MKRILSFLITLALIAGMVGCGTAAQYVLSVLSTSGGNVTHPGFGTFIYPAGAVVLLEAVPADGYSFASWSGNVSTVANVTAADTTITLKGNYLITANFGPFAGGSGTNGDPYHIADWYDLDSVRNYLDSYFILVNNLDSTTAGYEEVASETANQGKGWQPIGSGENRYAVFNGTFDGQGYKIHDLFINRPDEIFVGLFGVAFNGTIKNLGMVNVTVTGNGYVGCLVGDDLYGTVANCYSIGNVTSSESCSGGLIGAIGSGMDGGAVTNSYAWGTVVGTSNVGGLIGFDAGGDVSNCYSNANVTGGSGVGGLLGFLGIAVKWDGAPVSNCYSTGYVTYVSFGGGLVGDINGLEGCCDVSNSFWDNETSGQATSYGGTGETTAEMQGIATFSGAGWNIIAVANASTRNPGYIWNIVNGVTYPFLSWQS